MTQAQLRQFIRRTLIESKGMDPEQVARNTVASYTEISPGRVEKAAQTSEDPSHPGAVAVRLKMHGSTMDFLVHNCDGTPDPMVDVEEVEFTSWPPTRSGRAGKLKMGRF